MALVYLLKRPVAQVDDAAADTPEVAPAVDEAEIELACAAWAGMTESERLRVGAWLMKWKSSNQK